MNSLIFTFFFSSTFVLSIDIRWKHTLEDVRQTLLVPRTIGNYLPLTFQSTSKENGDGLFGCIYAAGNSNTPPFLEMGIFQPATLFTKSAWAHTSDYGLATNYIGGTIMALEEWNGQTLVQSVTLNYLPWSYTHVYDTDLTVSTYKSGWTGNWGNSNQQGGGGGGGQNNNRNNQRPSGQNNGFKTFGNLNVTIAIAATNVTGVLTSGRWVSPRAYNVFIEIYDFPYRSTSNSLHLTFGILSASRQTSTVQVLEDDTQHTELMGEGEDAVMVNFPKHAAVDGHIVTLKTVSNFSASDNDLFNWKLATIIKPYLVAGGLQTVCRTFRVIFPAGSKNITYEPTYGIYHKFQALDAASESWEHFVSVTVIVALIFSGILIVYLRLLKKNCFPNLTLHSVISYLQGYRSIDDLSAPVKGLEQGSVTDRVGVGVDVGAVVGVTKAVPASVMPSEECPLSLKARAVEQA